MVKKEDSFEKKVEKQKEKIKDFAELLDSLDLNDKKKLLWKEIYENALHDRIKAEILYSNLLHTITRDPNNHTILGSVITKYLERMEKSNGQILRLAELIQKAQEENKKYNKDDIYNQIGTG